MTYRDEETGSLTLRTVRLKTIDELYELKALKDKPICRLVDEILTDHLEKDPSLLAMRQEEVRRLAEEYSGVDLDADLDADIERCLRALSKMD